MGFLLVASINAYNTPMVRTEPQEFRAVSNIEPVKAEEETTQVETVVEEPIPTEEDVSTYEYEEPAYVEPWNIYKYCPVSINGNVFYCSNLDNPGSVTDGIFLNNGTKVLGTTPGSWDSAQVCDPSVISGSFNYNGENYCYLMAYLGCVTYDCTNNEIGFAVSNDLVNWVKTGKVISAAWDGAWGVGQPCLINKDGNVILFYTSGTVSKTTTYAIRLNCSNLNNIGYLESCEIRVPDFHVSNADFAIEGDYLYITCDTHPFSGGNLNFISDAQSIYRTPFTSADLNTFSNNWELVARIGSETTGHLKNHNAGFIRDGYGNLIYHGLLVTTGDDLGTDFLTNLWTYRYMEVGF